MKVTVLQEGESPAVLSIIGHEFTVGRHPDCDVVLPHSFVSARHARVFAGALVEDLGSRNGTFVEGERIEAPTLLTGRPFRIGGGSLELSIEMEERDGMAQTLAAALAAPRWVKDLDPSVGSTAKAREAKAAPADESSLLERLVRDDFDGVQIADDAPATDLYLFEAFQFIRNAERVVSKIAGGLTRELSQRTVLPDADKNFRACMADLLARRHDPGARAELHEYLAKVFEWLYAAVHCYQKAALSVVEELRSELGASALLRAEPLPWQARLPQGEHAALWERAQMRLETWNQAHVLDRLESEVTAAAKAFRLGAEGDDL